MRAADARRVACALTAAFDIMLALRTRVHACGGPGCGGQRHGNGNPMQHSGEVQRKAAKRAFLLQQHARPALFFNVAGGTLLPRRDINMKDGFGCLES